jgi:hypothetical protein
VVSKVYAAREPVRFSNVESVRERAAKARFGGRLRLDYAAGDAKWTTIGRCCGLPEFLELLDSPNSSERKSGTKLIKCLTRQLRFFGGRKVQ